MSKVSILAMLCCLMVAGQAFSVTVNLDGILNEWTGGDVVNLGSSGAYTLLATWDQTNLYIGVDRSASGRYLGDDYGVHDSFFVAIDIDGVPGSGGSDGYGNVSLSGAMLPDRIYYYAGGQGWHEVSFWDGIGWNWLGWTNANTYYGWQPANPNDELGIALSDIGGSHQVMIWAWMTVEGVYDSTTAFWGDPAGNGIMIPEPATMALLGLGALAMFRRKR